MFVCECSAVLVCGRASAVLVCGRRTQQARQRTTVAGLGSPAQGQSSIVITINCNLTREGRRARRGKKGTTINHRHESAGELES